MIIASNRIDNEFVSEYLFLLNLLYLFLQRKHILDTTDYLLRIILQVLIYRWRQMQYFSSNEI